ncbi:sorting nexin 13 [Physocladia obscura]|uniref:Sorting nexin 13 n=1 Tax=Physocladia obscura TaxID=109957 RepID=A0AAD5T5X1_9FUNG|nr:sorting nexin 13 [Physocladia obscura]
MEDFIFDWPNNGQRNTGIVIQIFETRILSDELLGVVFIPTESLQANKYSKEWYVIDTSESRLASSSFMAQIYVEAMVVSISNVDEKRTNSPEQILVEQRKLTPTPIVQSTKSDSEASVILLSEKKELLANTFVEALVSTDIEPINKETVQLNLSSNFNSEFNDFQVNSESSDVHEISESIDLQIESNEAGYSGASEKSVDSEKIALDSTETLVEVSISSIQPGNESLNIIEILDNPELMRDFETYLDSENALGYLQLYATIAALKLEVNLDEARSVFDIFFSPPQLLQIDQSVVERLNRKLFGNNVSQSKIFLSETIFGDTKDAALTVLSRFWIQFKNSEKQSPNAVSNATAAAPFATPIFNVIFDDSTTLEPAFQSETKLIEFEIPPQKPARPLKPPRITNSEVNPPPQLPPRNDVNSVTPPLPERPSVVPPPLPSRITEAEAKAEAEAEAKRKFEEDDLKLALALQEEEYQIQQQIKEARKRQAGIRTTSLSVDTVSNASSNYVSNTNDVTHSPGTSTDNASPVLTLNAPISFEIDELKGKVNAIEKILEQASDNDESSQKLLMEKLEAQAKIEKLTEMQREAEEKTIPLSAGHNTISSSNIAISLFGANISIFEIADHNQQLQRRETTSFFDASSPPPPYPIFSVLVEPTNHKAGGWVLTRKLSEFFSCYDILASEYPKIRSSVCPGVWVRTGAVPLPLHSADHRVALAKELEMWIRFVVSDETVCTSVALHTLLGPDYLRQQRKTTKKSANTALGGRNPTTSSTNSNSRQQQPQPVAFGQMLGALKSAGSVLKNVAVSTGNAIGNAAKEISANESGRLEYKRSATSLNGSAMPSRASSLSKQQEAAGATVSRNSMTVLSQQKDALFDDKSINGMTAVHRPTTVKNKTNQSSNIPGRNPSPTRTLFSTNNITVQQTSSSISDSTGTRTTTAKVLPVAALTPQYQAELSQADLSILLECAFGVIEEVFNLSDPNQWIRQRGLKVVKSVLRNSYGGTISSMIQSQVDEIRTPESIAGMLDSVCGYLWVDGVFQFTTPEYLAQLEADKLNPPTESQLSDTRIAAKNLLLNNTSLLGLDGVQTVLGKQNTMLGISRLFNMLQYRELNRGLICAVLEALVKNIFSEN